MFCPKCGKSDQSPETYCRQCGIFLPDLSKPVKRGQPAETHLTANTVLSIMTIIVSFTMALLLYLFVAFKDDTHPLVYVTAGLLLAMGFWHIQTFIRTLMLRKQWKRMIPPTRAEIEGENSEESPMLCEADFDNIVPASVTDNTTRNLSPDLTQTKHKSD